MSGHSKWNNIKNRKDAVDGQRAQAFSQIAKLIRISVKESQSGDPRFNASLRALLDKARLANMPKEKVQRAIDTGLGKGASGSVQETVYEGFGPGGVALIIVAYTDNSNRTSSEIRFALSRGGGSLAGPGSAMYMFKRNGEEYQTTIPMEVADDATKQQLRDLVDQLRDNEDVEDVYTNTTL